MICLNKVHIKIFPIFQNQEYGSVSFDPNVCYITYHKFVPWTRQQRGGEAVTGGGRAEGGRRPRCSQTRPKTGRLRRRVGGDDGSRPAEGRTCREVRRGGDPQLAADVTGIGSSHWIDALWFDYDLISLTNMMFPNAATASDNVAKT